MLELRRCIFYNKTPCSEVKLKRKSGNCTRFSWMKKIDYDKSSSNSIIIYRFIEMVRKA